MVRPVLRDLQGYQDSMACKGFPVLPADLAKMVLMGARGRKEILVIQANQVLGDSLAQEERKER